MQSVLSVRMDSATKESFSQFCEEAGLSVSTAINLFAKQTLRDQKIPFEISLAPTAFQGAKAADGGKPLPLSLIKSAVSEAAEEFPEIERVTLFGSYARGEATEESDIDLRLTLSEGGRFSLMNLAAFSNQVSELAGKPVDAITKRDLANDDLATAIRREGVVIYEREEFR